MKELSLIQMNDLQGGGFWSGACAGLGIGGGVAAAVEIFVAGSVATAATGPAAIGIGLTLAGASIACGIAFAE